ncbi:MAG: class I SAM-dependent methyltransferase [Gammaproteobacteria bacterium]|nr:class I SAM-dependent methyltransferase [Gammaproteobacteria bacterium]HRX70403.1 class I SAM-dependent methyltransferase [Candidatus Competibacteraceae bacterium]
MHGETVEGIRVQECKISSFSAKWLALREPVDTASRNAELTARLLEWRERLDTLAVLDLASGTGANFRFLAPLLGGEQYWRLIDHDPALLAQGNSGSSNAFWQVERQCLNLADWESLDFQSVQLVTASALIDLVSADWLDQLAQHCRAAQAVVFIVLSYDGTIVWEPALAGDERVREWINHHQRTDKGFGPALGPWAAPEFGKMLERLDYQVELRPSPWRLEPEQITLQATLLEGWITVVREIAPDATDWLDQWAAQRCDLIESGNSRLTVGHWDLLALKSREADLTTYQFLIADRSIACSS